MEFQLDTSGLRRSGRRFIPDTEESFAAEYYRAMQQLNEQHRITVSEKDGPEGVVAAVNETFDRMRRQLCRHMHQYLLDHDGKVGRWPDPRSAVSRVFEKLMPGTEFVFVYFDYPYVYDPEENDAIRPQGIYQFTDYYESAPAPQRDHEAAVRAQIKRKFGSMAEEAEDRRKQAQAAVAAARKDRPRRGRGLFGLILSLLVLAILAAGYLGPYLGLFDPATLWSGPMDAMRALTGWQAVAAMLPRLVMGLVQVAVLLVSMIGMALLEKAGMTAYVIGGVVTAVIAVMLLRLVWAVWPVKELFRRDPTVRARQVRDEAERAAEAAKAEKQRLEKEYLAEHMPRATALDDEAYEAWEADQAAQREFAREWQLAWLEEIRRILRQMEEAHEISLWDRADTARYEKLIGRELS